MKPLIGLLQNLRLRLLLAQARWRRKPQVEVHASSSPELDLVFVTPPESAKGWILDAICREIGSRLPGLKVAYCRFGSPHPAARSHFHSHYMYFVGSLQFQRALPAGRHYVFATHLEPEKHRIDDRLLAQLLNLADGVICMNRALRDKLAALGVAAGKLTVVVGAADSTLFQPHVRREDGKVGFCAAFYERKSPDRILQIITSMPHRRFVLLGKGWQQYRRFEELRDAPNLEYVEAGYEAYPAYYAQMSVFISASQLEGGPIPLLEAMMSNAVPVASRTGFAPDIIQHGVNGLLFDIDSPVEAICRLVDQAFTLDADVARTVAGCDWIPFTAAVVETMGLDANVSAPKAGTSQSTAKS